MLTYHSTGNKPFNFNISKVVVIFFLKNQLSFQWFRYENEQER